MTPSVSSVRQGFDYHTVLAFLFAGWFVMPHKTLLLPGGARYALPATMPMWAQEELAGELQRLADLLGLRDGVFNIETRVATDGKAYIMESSPRGGGNRLCEMLKYATAGKTDLVTAAVKAALGEPVGELPMPEYDGFWYQQMLHADHDGVFAGIEYASGFSDAHVAEEQLWVEPG